MTCAVAAGTVASTAVSTVRDATHGAGVSRLFLDIVVSLQPMPNRSQGTPAPRRRVAGTHPNVRRGLAGVLATVAALEASPPHRRRPEDAAIHRHGTGPGVSRDGSRSPTFPP